MPIDLAGWAGNTTEFALEIVGARKLAAGMTNGDLAVCPLVGRDGSWGIASLGRTSLVFPAALLPCCPLFVSVITGFSSSTSTSSALASAFAVALLVVAVEFLVRRISVFGRLVLLTIVTEELVLHAAFGYSGPVVGRQAAAIDAGLETVVVRESMQPATGSPPTTAES